MTCPSELSYSMYVDGALPAEEVVSLMAHLKTCEHCQSLLTGLTLEREVLTTALQQTDEEIVVPKFRRSVSLRTLLGFFAGAIAPLWGIRTVWGAVSSFSIPAGLQWLNPFDAIGLMDLAFSSVIGLFYEGTTMIDSIVTSIGTSIFVALVAWGVFSVVKRRTGISVLASVALLIMVAPSLQAFEIQRSDEFVNVAAGEVIDDTLIAMSDSVTVDGTINGDLVALARRVVVRGTVNGNLLTAAESVSVEGRVTGTVLGFARSLDFADGQIGRNLYGFARDISTNTETDVEGNAAVFAEEAELEGQIGVDLIGFAEELELSGNVARDFTAFAESVTLQAPARVNRNLTAYLASEDDLRMAPGTTVGGTTDTQIVDDDGPRNRYLSDDFYMLQALRLGAAFVTGLIFLWLFPVLRTVAVGKGSEGLKTGGIGLLALIATPILIVIAAVTVVGIPLALMSVALFLTAIYLAKIVSAVFVGRVLLETSNRHYAIILLAGLVAVLIAINIPFIGGLLNVLLTILGLGIIAELVMAQSRARS